MDISQLQTLLLIIHLFGIALGAGGAFISDGIFFASLKNRKVSKDEYRILKVASKITWIGLILLLISGTGLFTLNPEALSASIGFLVKITIVGTLLINGILFHFIHLPFIGRNLEKLLSEKKILSKMKNIPLLLTSGVVSVISWSAAIILGALHSIPFSYFGALSLYVGVIGLGIFCSLIIFYRYLDVRNIKHTFIAGIGTLVLAGLLLAISLLTSGFLNDNAHHNKISLPVDEITEIDSPVYTLEEII